MGRICLKRGWQHIAVFVFGEMSNRGMWDFRTGGELVHVFGFVDFVVS
jgi:hypothetical protein